MVKMRGLWTCKVGEKHTFTYDGGDRCPKGHYLGGFWDGIRQEQRCKLPPTQGSQSASL